MKYFSMFSGIGGFEEGIRRTIPKAECIGYSEIDKYATQIYKRHFPKHKNYGDATKINTDELPDFDLLCGGFPCQPFSISGKRKGFQDIRGTLFAEIIRIAKAKRPRILLLENVKGLLSADDGRCFATILSSMDELRYNAEWEILNSKNFGVPQNRERVFLIGHLREECGRKVFPIGECCEPTNGQRTKKRMEQTAQCLRARDYANMNGNFVSSEINPILEQTKGNSQGERIYDTNGVSQTLSSNGGGMGAKTGLYLVKNKPEVIGMIKQVATKRVNDTPKEINQYLKDNKGKISITALSEKLKLPKTQVEHYFRTDKSRAIPSPKIWLTLKKLLKLDNKYDKDVLSIYEKEIEFESSRRVFGIDGIAPTIDSTSKGKIIKTKQSNIIRRLTPKECERLQGFEDSWTKYGIDEQGNEVEISDTQRYKCLGNAVTVNVIEEIMKRLTKTPTF